MSRRIKTILIEGEYETMKAPKVSASERTWYRFRTRKNFPTEADKQRLKIYQDSYAKERSKE